MANEVDTDVQYRSSVGEAEFCRRHNHVVAFCRAIYPTTECRRLLLKLYSTLGHNHRILFPMNMLM